MRAADHVDRALRMLARDAPQFRRGDKVVYEGTPATFLEYTQENEAEINLGGQRMRVEVARLSPSKYGPQ